MGAQTCSGGGQGGVFTAGEDTAAHGSAVQADTERKGSSTGVQRPKTGPGHAQDTAVHVLSAPRHGDYARYGGGNLRGGQNGADDDLGPTAITRQMVHAELT